VNPTTEAKYHAQVKTEALSRFGAKKKDSKEIWRSECFVFSYTKNNKDYILKLTHSDIRNAKYIMGELDFLNALRKGGVRAAVPVISEAGNYVEVIDDKSNPGEFFIAYAFERMQGKLGEDCRQTSKLIHNWGLTMGEMHRLTKKYKVKDSSIKRYHWHERNLIADYRGFIKNGSDSFYEGVNKLVKRGKSYPVNKNSYGLVHADMHVRNFFVDRGQVNVFDFDDLEYHYFVYDIAVPLNSYAKRDMKAAKKGINFFMTNFMEGYYKANHLAKKWLEVMNDFLLIRRLYLISMLHQSDYINRLSKKHKEFIQMDMHLLENSLPVSEVDYTKFAA
jgi:amicoumacin kinase